MNKPVFYSGAHKALAAAFLNYLYFKPDQQIFGTTKSKSAKKSKRSSHNPHQGYKEKARRLRQLGKGQLQFHY